MCRHLHRGKGGGWQQCTHRASARNPWAHPGLISAQSWHPAAAWHPVVFLKSGTTPTNVVLRNSMSNVSKVSMVSVAFKTYKVTQCLKVI